MFDPSKKVANRFDKSQDLLHSFTDWDSVIREFEIIGESSKYLLKNNLIDAGTVKLVGTDTKFITNEAQKLLDDTEVYTQMAQASNPYGDGHACEKVIHYLMKCD